jgi:membrane protein DedA with SNARE-associated domain
MSHLGIQLARHGIGLVFGNVLVEQAGLPIPAIPVMVAAGGLAVEGRLTPWKVMTAAVGAVMLADTLWYLLGRWQGRRVLKTVCKIAISPDSCVRRMETLYQRFGLRSLLFCKFIPGFSTVAPPLAGTLKAPFARFMLFDALGGAIWAASALGVGALFHTALDRVFAVLDAMGSLAMVLVAATLAGYIGWRLVQRHRFMRDLRLARVSVDELTSLLASAEPPLVVDVRTRGGVWLDPRRIPGAVRMAFEDIGERLGALPRAREVVLYCT